jgi:hypothetical protein
MISVSSEGHGAAVLRKTYPASASGMSVKSTRGRGIRSCGVVLLAALSAEDQREEHARPIARNELLRLDRHVPRVLGLEGGVDRVTAPEELVHAEREDREAGLGVTLRFVRSEQPVPDSV